jgi:polyribonucleotide nucleotidyltransferase
MWKGLALGRKPLLQSSGAAGCRRWKSAEGTAATAASNAKKKSKPRRKKGPGGGGDKVVMEKARLINTTQTFETGRIARLANGAVFGRSGDTTVLATVVRGPPENEGELALNVEVREKAHAGGHIPGNRMRRDISNSDSTILKARIIDRAIRPLFPKDLSATVQIIATIQSYGESKTEPKDQAVGGSDPIALALNATSAALMVSDVPWMGPIGCVRVGMVNKKMVFNPTREQMNESCLDLLYAGTATNTLMMEMVNTLPQAGPQSCKDHDQELGATAVKEAELFAAFDLAQKNLPTLTKAMDKMAKRAGRTKFSSQGEGALSEDADFEQLERVASMERLLEASFSNKMDAIYQPKSKKFLDKTKRSQEEGRLHKGMRDFLLEHKKVATPSFGECDAIVQNFMHHRMRNVMRGNLRVDGRPADKVRQLNAQVGVLPPAVHGSSLFSRGQTQVMGTVSLGTSKDAMLVDDNLTGEMEARQFMLHYDFPPFSVDETGLSLSFPLLSLPPPLSPLLLLLLLLLPPRKQLGSEISPGRTFLCSPPFPRLEHCPPPRPPPSRSAPPIFSLPACFFLSQLKRTQIKVKLVLRTGA